MIRLSKSCLSDSEKTAVIKVLDKEFLGMGEEVEKFEKDLKKYFNRPVVCVVNGTAALQLAMQAIKISNDDQVLVPGLTYVASFQAISATGATPVACDIDLDTFLIDLDDAEKRITSKTKAIMPVHYNGGVGDLNSIYQFANKHGLRVVEDAAHAFGTVYEGQKVGSFGDIVCFSFDGIKNITSGEGGCIVTNDTEVQNKIKDLRLLGVQKDTEKRYTGERSWDFQVSEQGWRYHMSNIMAAIGIEQLKRFPDFSMKRKKLAKLYDRLLDDSKIIIPLKRDYQTVVPHIYVVRILGMKNRKNIQKKMLDMGIQVGYHYQPNHWLEYYKDHNENNLQITDQVSNELLTLPLHPDLSYDQVEFIVKTLNSIIRDSIEP